VGEVALAADGTRQIIALSPACGTNCEVWLFVRDAGHLRPVLRPVGTSLGIGKTSTRGFPDIVASEHMTGYEQLYTLYRWHGRKYVQADCHGEQYDRDDPDKPPKIVGCNPAGAVLRVPPQPRPGR